MKDSIKKVAIIGSGMDSSVSLKLLQNTKSIHIKTKDELTNDNVKKWIEDGITVLIIDSDGTRLEHESLHVNDKPFVITMCDNYVDIDFLIHGKQEKKQRKEHYRAVQNKHSFKNNYKPYRK